MYLDDPTAYFAPMEAKWTEYIERGDEIMKEVESSVVEWRTPISDPYSSNYLPVHPLWKTIDVEDASGRWRARTIRWENNDQAVERILRYGFDSKGRLVFRKSHQGDHAVVFGDRYYDLLHKYQNLAVGIDRHYHKPAPEGVRLGGFRRFLVDDRGRICTSLRISNYDADPECHCREIERFRWEGNRLVESFRQSFNLGTKLPEVTKRNPAERVARLYRRVNESLREGMYRVRYAYHYADDDSVASVESYQELDRWHDTPYVRKSSDTIDGIIAELAPLLAKAIVKLVKETKAAHPVRRVALLYLSEHAHCGLPTYVRLLGANDVMNDSQHEDPYPHLTSWPAGQSRKISSCFSRLYGLVEDNPKFEDDAQPRPYREVLWKTSRMIYDELVGKKKVVADDFAVYPIDQHGDADEHEDIRESLPADVAERVISAKR